MKQEVTFKEDARVEIAKGVNTIADAVKVTLGGKGRNVIIDQIGRPPVITKDGVSVARSINLGSGIAGMSAKLMQEIALKTAEDAGDGTTTSTVIAQYILNQGLDLIKDGYKSVEIKEGIDLAVKDIVEALKDMSVDISDNYEDLLSIATVSANGSEDIGKLVADIMFKIKLDGIVIVKESDLPKTFVDRIEGAKINNGYESPAFINKSESLEAIIDKPVIMMCDQHMATTKDITPILEAYFSLPEEGRGPLVWLVSEMDGEALSTIISNHNGFYKSKGKEGLMSLVVKIPGNSQMKTDTLTDLSSLIGGTVISHNEGVSVNDFTKEMFGFADRVVSESDQTMILGGEGEKLVERVTTLREQIKSSSDDKLKKMSIEGRLARLTGGVAIIRVGGTTHIETKERFDLIEDAVGASKAALEEGIVPGGGISYINFEAEREEFSSESVEKGYDIVVDAIREPFNVIMDNAGENPDEISRVILEKGDMDYGYNVKTKKYIDMLEGGIIDPTKVSRVALENSASIAGLFLTTEAVVSNIQE
jgi:chaperonin GroEL